MATLNQIVTQLADALNRPFDDMLKARLKDLVIQEFSLYVSRSISKYGVDKEFVYSYYITELTLVTKVNGVTLSKPYLQTTNTIPRPLRYIGDSPFIYVGLEEGDVPFSFRNIHSRRYTNLLPNVGLYPSFDFHQDRIRIWNYPTITIPADPNATPPTEESIVPISTLLVQQVPADPRADITPDSNEAWIFGNDKEFPVTVDFVQQIKLSLLKGELSVTDSKDKIEATHLDNN